MPARLVDDLVFFGAAEASCFDFFVGDCELRRSWLVFDAGIELFGRTFEGEDGGDRALFCRSPSTLLLAACGWSGGSNGTV